MAITWPVSNLNTVVAVAYGVWILKEADLKKHKNDLRFGLLMATLGVVLLALSMR